MRKIYSIVLMACAMLLSTSLFAVDVTVPAQKTLQEAVDLDGDEINITLNTDVTISDPVRIYKGKTITLNLNGNNITGNPGKNNALIYLYKGTLDVKGSGTIQNDYTGDAALCFQVEGQMDHTKADWSVLKIGKDVNVLAVAGSNGKAIVIDGKSLAPSYTYISQEVGTGKLIADDYLTNDAHYTDYALRSGAGNNDPIDKNTSGTSIYNLIGFANICPVYTDIADKKYKKGESTAISAKQRTSTRVMAYGVRIEIDGFVHGTEYGIKNNGNTDLDAAGNKDNVALVNVNSTAKVWGSSSATSTAIASNGYGHFVIKGEVVGGTGVYVKSGEIDLVDAVVKSNYVGTYNDPVGKGSGINAGGSAIVIESNKSYMGGQDVTISGDTKLEGGSGYAVQELITTAAETKVSSVTIEGGTIEAGDKGAIVVEKETTEKSEVVIVGGNIENSVQIKDGMTLTPATIDDFFPTDGETYVSTTVKNEEGQDVIVVTKLDGSTIDKSADNSVVATPEGEGIIWDNATTKEETIQTSRTFSYIQISENYGQKLNIGDATHKVVVKVGRIVLGTDAQIVVSAGSTLIITGDQGIYAPVNSNIVLETAEGNPAQLLFSPAVVSNRHPQATVKFKSKAYRKDNGDNIYQFFGSPFTAVDNLTTSSTTHATEINVWNVNKYDFVGILNYDKVGLDASNAINYSKFNKTFGFYSMMSNNPLGQEQTYTFTGRLIGNENPNLPLYTHYTGMSNAYAGKIKVTALEEANEARQAAGSNVVIAIYTYKQMGNALVWTANNELQRTVEEIDPMQPFMMENLGANPEELNFSYNDLVWVPATKKEENAPARRNLPADMTKATLRVNGTNGIFDLLTIAESDEFTAGRDKYDADKYMNTDVNFYVMDENKMNILATNDVENTYLGFSCVNGGEFTISFENVQGNALTLIDLVNNTSVDMTEGATYTFTAAANEANDYRFKVVNRRNAATALENTEAAVKAEGIYTLTGMYLGNMSVWNTLPAGIYVVNGEKMVK